MKKSIGTKAKGGMILKGAVIVLNLALLGGLGYWGYTQKTANTALVEQHKQETAKMRSQLESFGDVQEVYYTDSEISANTKIDKNKLSKREVPASMFSTSYIVDPVIFETTIAKVKIAPNSPILKDMLMPELVYNDDRNFDVVADAFPVHVQKDDFIDYILVSPRGRQYVVIPKARVVEREANTLTLKVTQEDIHRYNSALIDRYLNPGTLLTATTYIEPGLQSAALAYYPVSETILNNMNENPNIVEIAAQDVIKKRRVAFENHLTLTEDQMEVVSEGTSVLITKMLTDLQTVRDREAEAEGQEKLLNQEGEEVAAGEEGATE